MAQPNCPHCGAALSPQEAAAIIVCEYCGAASVVAKGDLNLIGVQAPLLERAALFQVGQTATVAGQPCSVLGLVRYAYEDGEWDEWSLFFEDGSLGWLQEDEGELTLFRACERTPAATALSARPGSFLEALGHKIFVSEVGEATLLGGKGQITSFFSPGQAFDFVDGLIDGRQAILMSGGAETVLFLGEALERDQVQR